MRSARRAPTSATTSGSRGWTSRSDGDAERRLPRPSARHRLDRVRVAGEPDAAGQLPRLVLGRRLPRRQGRLARLRGSDGRRLGPAAANQECSDQPTPNPHCQDPRRGRGGGLEPDRLPVQELHGSRTTPYNLDYTFRAGIFMGDYENVDIEADDAAASWTDARNGRSSGNSTSPNYQFGRNPSCEQSDAFFDRLLGEERRGRCGQGKSGGRRVRRHAVPADIKDRADRTRSSP